MTEHILFLTGKLAEKNLRRVLQDMQPTEFTCDGRQIGISVAALMTTEMILDHTVLVKMAFIIMQRMIQFVNVNIIF